MQSAGSVRTTGTFQFGLYDAAPFACTLSKRGHAFLTKTLCGNGVKNGGEDCDDGNNTDTDTCTNACTAAKCGDGVVQAGVEECDDGNSNDADACSNACKSAFKDVSFTNCGKTGISGPNQSQCDSAYAGSPLAGKVSVSNGIQKWIVPHTGNYATEGFGASGAGHDSGGPGYGGGGGSFNGGANPSATSGANDGHGKLTISAG